MTRLISPKTTLTTPPNPEPALSGAVELPERPPIPQPYSDAIYKAFSQAVEAYKSQDWLLLVAAGWSLVSLGNLLHQGTKPC